jgi:hypothetical protein
MPIRINLLAEALADEDLRRRDPVRRTLYLGAFGVVLSLVWFSSIWLTSLISKQRLDRIQAGIQSCTNDLAQVRNSRKSIAETQKRMEALQQLSNARFLQGTLMNALQQAYAPNVQLTRLHVDQNYSVLAASPAKTNTSGTVPGLPSKISERIVLTLDARDYGPSPGDGVNHFKDALLRQDFFKSNLNLTNGIHLSNISTPQTMPEGKSSVQFSLECRFQERVQ